MTINPNKVFEDRLIHSLGLKQYEYILNEVKNTNVYNNRPLQTCINGYYVVRRNEEWRKQFYSLFEEAKNNNLTFENIITELYERTGNIEASFASKMYATINPDKPI